MLIGLVGKPNIGKSTFFKACTLAEVEIANYPFATIKPNHGVGYVKVPCAEREYGVKCNPRVGYCLNGNRFVPIDLLDVAGLVPGAYKGLGCGNQFLDDLNQADVLIHVVDIAGTTNDKGEPVDAGSYDPLNDIRFLDNELDMWYLRLMRKVWEKAAKLQNQENTQVAKVLHKQFSGLGASEDMIKGILSDMRLMETKMIKWSDEQIKDFSQNLRKLTKPMIIAANKIDIAGAKENLEKAKKEFPDLTIAGCSAESELALKEAAKHGLVDYIPGEADFSVKDESKLSEKQKKALGFIKENMLDKLGSTGVQQVVNHAVFDVLKYIAVFPGGVHKLEDKDGRVLPDCFLIPEGSTALDFAYRVHTDLGKKFIKAMDVKTKLAVGKEHVLKNLDIVEIIT